MAMAVSNQQSRDAALLRAMTELFVLEKKHDPGALRRFEELATHYLGRVSAADRAFVAEKLSRSADAPTAVLRLLGKDMLEIAHPILKRSQALGEFDFLTIIAATGHPHHRVIALRTDLTPLVVSALRLTGDAEVVARLATYPDVVTEQAGEPETEPLFETTAPSLVEPVLAEPAPDESTLARSLSDVTLSEASGQPGSTSAESAQAEPSAKEAVPAPAIEAEPEPEALPSAKNPSGQGVVERVPASPEAALNVAVADALAAGVQGLGGQIEASLPQMPQDDAVAAIEWNGPAAFLDLDRNGRLAVLRHFAAQGTVASARSRSLDADQAFRVALGRARLTSIARQRQRDALIGALAQGLRLKEDEVAALLADPSGEPLIVLLRGIGLSETEALQVLLFANPVVAEGVESFERLGRLLLETSEEVATAVIALWRGEKTAGSAKASPSSHQPLFADLPMRRGLHGATTETAHRAEPAERGLASSTRR